MPTGPTIDESRRRQQAEANDELDDNEQAPIGTPNEYTRLLPSRVDSNQGLLTPDDPAVTPYNLWTIRILRYATIAMTVLTFVWWTILLVATFATPPGFHQRGSNFYAFSFASLAFAILLFTLVFFGVPAKSVRILTIVMSVRFPLLLINPTD